MKEKEYAREQFRNCRDLKWLAFNNENDERVTYKRTLFGMKKVKGNKLKMIVPWKAKEDFKLFISK